MAITGFNTVDHISSLNEEADYAFVEVLLLEKNSVMKLGDRDVPTSTALQVNNTAIVFLQKVPDKMGHYTFAPAKFTEERTVIFDSAFMSKSGHIEFIVGFRPIIDLIGSSKNQETKSDIRLHFGTTEVLYAGVKKPYKESSKWGFFSQCLLGEDTNGRSLKGRALALHTVEASQSIHTRVASGDDEGDITIKLTEGLRDSKKSDPLLKKNVPTSKTRGGGQVVQERSIVYKEPDVQTTRTTNTRTRGASSLKALRAGAGKKDSTRYGSSTAVQTVIFEGEIKLRAVCDENSLEEINLLSDNELERAYAFAYWLSEDPNKNNDAYDNRYGEICIRDNPALTRMAIHCVRMQNTYQNTNELKSILPLAEALEELINATHLVAPVTISLEDQEIIENGLYFVIERDVLMSIILEHKEVRVISFGPTPAKVENDSNDPQPQYPTNFNSDEGISTNSPSGSKTYVDSDNDDEPPYYDDSDDSCVIAG